MRLAPAVLTFLVFPALLSAQAPVTRDTTARDTTATELPDITVTVTRAPERVAQIPAAIGVVDRHEIQGAQATLGLDESLNNIPGVYVANRYNYSLDQRLSIRGFGSRAAFGLRGVKVLLDGIPQTLPDGQSQLSNVDFSNLQRIEVLRGASSSLYGNASGGVLSLTSEPAAPGPFSQSVRGEGGSFGLLRLQERTTARRGAASGVLTVSHTNVDGFRQHSKTRFTQVNLDGDYVTPGATVLGVRFGYSDAPQAQNPGALTLTEVLANPDSAAANNIRREADKDVSQGQLAFTAKRHTDRGEWNVALFGFLRNLDNPIAAPPPQGPGPTVGTYIAIDRQVLGVRASTEQRLGSDPAGPRLTAGVDLQRLRDDRTNARAVAGVPDTLVLDQREKVTELGPFVQLHWPVARDVILAVGGRYDAVKFQVEDHFLGDGVDNSGDRTMSAFSGNGGLTWVGSETFNPYVNVSTSFETPTTTELANQPNSSGGFNTSLDPSHAVNYEIGARGTVGPISYTASGFIGRVRDAIVPFEETSGRAYFTNAGKLKNDGIELGLTARLTPRLRVFGAYTYAHYRFGTYRVVSGTTVDTLDGKLLPGVPKAFIRLGLRAGPVDGFSLDVDHTMASSIFANDDNTLYVNGWGKSGPGVVNGVGLGVTNARLSWRGRAGGAWIQPFLGVNNLWDRTYVSSLTINGTFGRVFEPAPGRNWYLGGEIGWAAP